MIHGFLYAVIVYPLHLLCFSCHSKLNLCAVKFSFVDMSDIGNSEHSATTQRQDDIQHSSSQRGESQPPIPSADIAGAFDLLRSYLDVKLGDLKADLASEQDCISRKIKEEVAIKFKKEGNGIQFRFNEEVLNGLLKLQRLSCIDSSASSIVFDLIGKIKSRNKLIRIADTSAGGWGTVKEYESNVVADDSDDEKKIRQAESRALKSSKEKAKSRPSPYNLANRSTGSYRIETAPNPASANLYVPPIPAQQPFRGGYARRGSCNWDLCHQCKQYGHWRKNCPLNRNQLQPTQNNRSGQGALRYL